MREVLYHDALLLARGCAATGLLHEVKDPLAVLALPCTVVVLMRGEVCVLQEVGVAELAHQGTAQGRRVGECAQGFARDARTTHICGESSR